MVCSVLFVGAVVVLEALPVHLLVMAAFQGRQLGGFDWIRIAASSALILAVCAVVFVQIDFARLASVRFEQPV